MPKTSPLGETPVDIITQQPILPASGSSSTFQLTWPAGEDPPVHSIPSAPSAIIEFQHIDKPSAINPFFDPVPMPVAELSHPVSPSGGDKLAGGGVSAAVNLEDGPKRSRPPPPFARAFSAPLPAQLKHLRHPSRKNVAEPVPTPVVIPPQRALPAHPSGGSQIDELALELADSVQMVIQTLIQISPPHLLDAAKEQLAGCTLQLPTPSIAALLTTMKNLNYMSANLSELSTPDRSPGNMPSLTEEDLHSVSSINAVDLSQLVGNGQEIFATRPISIVLDDFDIGEVLQSVGDVLSGMAADAGVDLVLYHADVGMKHVNVKGDECGISYALCHVIRQLIMSASKGDEIEIGLFISSPTAAARLSLEDPSASTSPSPASSFNPDEPLMCTLEITHKFATNPMQELHQAARSNPEFNTTILQRLLRHVRATLQTDIVPSSGLPSRACRALEFSVLLSPGPPTSESPVLSEEDAKARQPFHDFLVATEPSLDELATFVAAEGDMASGIGGLKGKKAIFHASERSSFAHHLTSYLTAWGLDVSHMSTGTTDSGVTTDDGTVDGATSESGDQQDSSESSRSRSRSGSESKQALETERRSLKTDSPRDSPKSESPTHSFSRSRILDPTLADIKADASDSEGASVLELAGTSFIIIDDDVAVLRRRLAQIRKLAEKRLFPSHLLPQQAKKKRPSLHHRPRSSPSIRMAPPILPAIPGTIEESGSEGEDNKTPEFDPMQVVVVHFTSLSNYKTVQDIIQASLFTTSARTFTTTYSLAEVVPDVLVIPKPAGPRRFLTALYTAVRRPFVDPFFAPIATAPMSPTGQYRSVSSTSKLVGTPVEIPGAGARNVSGRQNSSGSAASSGSAISPASRLPTLSGDRRSPKDHPAEQERQQQPAMHIPMVPMTYTGTGQMYTPHPPSPLARDTAVEYFSVNNAQIGDSAGVLVHSPDGRPAGIFFQPQQQPRDGRRGTMSYTSGSDVSEIRSSFNRPPRNGSDFQAMGLDAAMATVTPVGTPGARYRVTGNDTPTMAAAMPLPPSRGSSGTSVPGRKQSTSGDDPGRPPMARMPSARLALPLPPAGSNARRKSAGNSPGEKTNDGLTRPRIIHAESGSRSSLVDSPTRSSPTTAFPGGGKKSGLRRSSGDKSALMAPLKKTKTPSDGSIIPPINVLIVEDNPINQTILCTFMKRKKISYGTAKNGQEAIDKWRVGNYHLILMDIQMPVKDGIEATKEIRSMEKERNIGIFPSTPPSELAASATASGVPHTPYRSAVIIVALTASSLKSDRVAALAAGCNDFLTKPVSMTWLNTKIIEWGSIKVLEMFQDPATARLFAGQNAKSKAIASHLKLPPSRNASPAPSMTDLPKMDRPSVTIQPPSTPEVPTVAKPKPSQPTALDIVGEESSHAHEVSGDDALKQHLEVAMAKETKQRELAANKRPIVLGEGGLSSGESSTSIESVLHGIPAIAEDAVVDSLPDPSPQPPAIPMAPPSAPPDVATGVLHVNPP